MNFWQFCDRNAGGVLLVIIVALVCLSGPCSKIAANTFCQEAPAAKP